MADDSGTWELIHAERAALADTLDGLTPGQWEAASLCGGWTVKLAAAHVVAGAEQTAPRFVGRLAASGFRFDTMIDRDAHRLGGLDEAELVARLRARTTTTNRPPAPVVTMLGEVVVHGADIRWPLGLPTGSSPGAVADCLDLYRSANFPVGAKRRIAGLRLVATDVDWAHGEGPEVAGPGVALLLAMTGRTGADAALGGDGVELLRSRLAGSGAAARVRPDGSG